MDKPFIYIPIENYSSSPFDIVPPENYIEPLNKETGEQFPFCCNFHRSIYEAVKKDVEDFLIDQVKNAGQIKNGSWFDTKYFNNLPIKVTTQITYTEDHISNRIEMEDWFDDICEYIDYNVDSFGQPRYGLDTYLGNLPIILETIIPKIPVHKKQRLIEFIENYFKKSNPNKQVSKTDLNILYSTYQAWLKIFPFELETYFGNLKQHFEKQLPFINGQTNVNRYSYKSTGYLHTKDSLIEALINLTNDLLTKINGVALYENGLITDASNIKLELVLNNRKLELKQGYKNSSPNEEQRYRKMLKKWFNDEKKFFNEITPLLKAETPQQSINIPVLKGNTEDKEKAQNILIVLSGLWLDKEKIMTDDEYKKVIEGVYHLIESGQVKPIDRKIKTSAPMQFLRRLFREVNTVLYGKGIKDCFIDFLHAYFECFSLSEQSTTKNNFKEYRNGDFSKDYNLTMESIKK